MNLEKFSFNPQTKITIRKKLYEHFLMEIETNNGIPTSKRNWIKKYNLYLGYIGIGNKPLIIITNPTTTLTLGEQYLNLSPLPVKQGEIIFNNKEIDEPTNPKVIEELKKEFSIHTKKQDNINVWKSLTLLHEINYLNIFFTLTTGVNPKEIQELTNEQANQLINEYLYSNLNKDTNLIYAFKPDLLTVNPELTDPDTIQKIQSHQIMITNSKTGKSTTANKTGILHDEASVSNLLGFSTANDIVHGSLTGAVKTQSLDEIQEKKDKSLWGGLLTAMELGQSRRSKGKQQILLELYCAIRFMGNPKRDSEERIKQIKAGTLQDFTLDFELITLFLDVITKITDNYEAFGSRIGLVLFGKNFSVVEGEENDLEKEKKLKAIVETIMDLSKNNFSKLILNENINKWLMKKYDDDYVNSIKEIIKIIEFDEIKNFLYGHINSYRHARGTALKLALIEKISDVINEKINVDEIINLSEQHLNNIKSINLTSFRDIARISAKSNVQKKILVSAYNNEPQHVKIVIKSIYDFLKEKSEEERKVERYINRDMINERIKVNIVEEKAEIKPVRVWNRFVENKVSINEKISKYGLQLLKVNNFDVVFVKKLDLLESLFKEEVEKPVNVDVVVEHKNY